MNMMISYQELVRTFLNFGDGVVICVPIQWYIKQLDLWVTV